MDATTEEMLTDVWAHRFLADPKLLNEVVDEDFNADDVAAQIGYSAPPPAGPVNDWEAL